MATRRFEDGFRISIDGLWTANDLSSLVRSLDDLYNVSTLLSQHLFSVEDIKLQSFPIDRRTIRRLALERGEGQPLAIRRISYASPGFADIAGLGRSLKEVRLLVFGVIDRILEHKQRNLENEKRAIANEKAKIANEKAKTDLQYLEKERAAESSHKQVIRDLSIVEKN